MAKMIKKNIKGTNKSVYKDAIRNTSSNAYSKSPKSKTSMMDRRKGRKKR